MKEYTSKRKIVLVGNSHIDMIYRWRLNETLGRVIPDTFRGVLDVMDRDDDLTYAQSQFALYETVKHSFPELWERIRGRIAEGRWIVAGGKWVEADTMLPGGESVIRQFLLSRIFLEEEMGLEPIRFAWVPDCFGGHSATIPQIYAGCGIEFYVFNRGCPDGIRCFNWKSPDGTSIFAYKIPEHYNLEVTPALADYANDWMDITGLSEAMVLYGEGDHGGGPRDEDMQKVRSLQEDSTFPLEIVHGTPVPILERAREARENWPVYEGDIGIRRATGNSRGAHISQARIKFLNRQLEHAILQAERFAVLGTICQRKFFFPRYDFTQLWKAYLLHQFHDTLPGTLVGDAVDDVLKDFAAQQGEAERLCRFGLEAIGARINTQGTGVPVAVYNGSPWSRSDVVSCTIHRPVREEVCRITDDQEREIYFEVQSVEGVEEDFILKFYAEDIPSLGFRLYRVHTCPEGITLGDSERLVDPVKADVDACSVWTNRIYMKWNNMGIEQITDRATNADLLSDTAFVPTLHREDSSNSWNLSLDGHKSPITPLSGPDILCNSPLELRLRWIGRSDDSLFVREISVRTGAEAVELKCTVDWHETDQLLTIDIPTTLSTNTGVFEAPYGWVHRERDGSFLPMQRWASLEDTARGIAVVNDGTYSVGGTGNLFQIPLLRAARDMDPRMDEGHHMFRFAITPYLLRDGKSQLIQRAIDFNEPLIARQETRHSGELPDWGTYRNDGELSSPYSFGTLNGKHTIMTVLKVTEGDWNPVELVVRMYETDGVGEDVVLSLMRPVADVREINHIEQEIAPTGFRRCSKQSFSFSMEPFGIRSFRITLESETEGG